MGVITELRDWVDTILSKLAVIKTVGSLAMKYTTFVNEECNRYNLDMVVELIMSYIKAAFYAAFLALFQTICMFSRLC